MKKRRWCFTKTSSDWKNKLNNKLTVLSDSVIYFKGGGLAAVKIFEIITSMTEILKSTRGVLWVNYQELFSTEDFILL